MKGIQCEILHRGWVTWKTFSYMTYTWVWMSCLDDPPINSYMLPLYPTLNKIYLILSQLISSYLILSDLIWSDLILSYLALSYLILSYLILSRYWVLNMMTATLTTSFSYTSWAHLIEVCPLGSNWRYMSALVKVMAWCRREDKAWSIPMLTHWNPVTSVN